MAKKCVQLLPPVISEQQEVLNYKKALDLGVDLIKGGMPLVIDWYKNYI